MVFSQKPKYNNMNLADIKLDVPTDFWLVHKKCQPVLALIVHRKNNEFTKLALRESSVTAADQRKTKTATVARERQAVKERARAMAATAVNSVKMQELKIQEKVASEMVASSKQKRAEKKLNLYAQFKDQMSPNEYRRKVRKQLDKMESSSEEDEEDQKLNDEGESDSDNESGNN